MLRHVLVEFPAYMQPRGCSVAASDEINKTEKYNDVISGVDFAPVAIETSGILIIII